MVYDEMDFSLVSGLFQIIGVAVFIARCGEYFQNREPSLWQDVTVMDWSGPIAIVAIILTLERLFKLTNGTEYYNVAIAVFTILYIHYSF